MSRISFIATTDSSWSVTDGALRIGIEIDEADGGKRAETVYFTVPDNFQAHPDLVCVALATLAGRKYPTVAFDFAASPRVQKAIATAYGVALEFRGAAPPPRQAGDGAVLNFSGGFDSMTALALAEGQPLRLLSMDYGGYFEREETYFRTFDTVICRTDLRQKGFHNDWRFMATGSLLLADMLDAGIAGFGAVLEASAWNFRPDYGYQRPGDFLLRAVGLEQSSWVRGLTEFGTAMAMLALKPDTIVPSLTSLAAPGSEKFLRKQLLVELAAELLALPLPAIGERQPPRQPVAFGTAFAIDFLALYFIKRLGRDYVSTFVSDIPDDDDLRDIIATNLDFYVKYNPSFISHIPPTMRNHVLARMHQAGLYPYGELDFQSFDRVRRYLGRRYPIGS